MWICLVKNFSPNFLNCVITWVMANEYSIAIWPGCLSTCVCVCVCVVVFTIIIIILLVCSCYVIIMMQSSPNLIHHLSLSLSFSSAGNCVWDTSFFYWFSKQHPCSRFSKSPQNRILTLYLNLTLSLSTALYITSLPSSNILHADSAWCWTGIIFTTLSISITIVFVCMFQYCQKINAIMMPSS